MKKVLLVSCEGLGNGGVQSVMMSIVRNLHKEYIFDILLFTSEDRYYDEEFLKYGGKIHRIPRYEGNNKIRNKIDYYIRGHYLYKRVKDLLRKEGPFDVVHCNDEFENGIIIKAAAECNVPIRVSHTHVISNKHNILATLLENHRKKLIETYATDKLGCSKEANESFYNNVKNTQVINNSFDDQRFNKEKVQLKKIDNLSIIQVGSYNETKNQLFTIDIINEIKKEIPNVHMSFVGFDMNGYLEKMKTRIIQLKLESNISFFPSNADIPQLLMNSSLFILPSKHEGFGIVLIEAQAMGLKCFVSETVQELLIVAESHI